VPISEAERRQWESMLRQLRRKRKDDKNHQDDRENERHLHIVTDADGDRASKQWWSDACEMEVHRWQSARHDPPFVMLGAGWREVMMVIEGVLQVPRAYVFAPVGYVGYVGS